MPRPRGHSKFHDESLLKMFLESSVSPEKVLNILLLTFCTTGESERLRASRVRGLQW